MGLKLQQLRHFTLVAEEKGFRNAAARANRSQAAISSSIRELENSLGQTLFEHGNKARLTPYGEACLPRIQDMLLRSERLEADLLAMARGETGQIRIASIPSVASQLLPEVLAEFTLRCPEVELSLEDDTAERVEQRLLQGEVDIALGNRVAETDQIRFQPLFSDPLGVVCSRQHPIAQLNRPLHWRELQGQSLIYNGTVRLLRHTPLHEVMEGARYRISNMMSLYPLLERNVGITTLPRMATSGAHPELIWLPLSSPVVERTIGIQTLAGRSLAPPAQVFSELCQQLLSENLNPKGE